MLVRAVEPRDLVGVTPLAGSHLRARTRLRAAARGDDGMLVAESADRIVGVASVRWAQDCDPPHPWLYGVHVAGDVRRSGIGRALVHAAEALARERAATHLSLDADEDDERARAFYAALGYAVVRPHRHRWRTVDPDSGVVLAEGVAATVVMRRRLDSPAAPPGRAP